MPFSRQYRTVTDKLPEVMDAIVDGMLRNGEPGVWNRSRSEVGERGPVVCTNPCGEIALEEWENCNLGHINLSEFGSDTEGAVEAHRLMTRFLLRATFADVPDPRQQPVLARNRRIGVGHFGYQGWLIQNGIRYSESANNTFVRQVLRRFRETARTEARAYAAELGIPEPVKVTTVAPTGSIAKLPGATEGIQPIYSRYFLRRVRLSVTDPELEALIRDGYSTEPDLYSTNTLVVVIPTKDTLIAQLESKGIGDREVLVEAADELELEALLGVQVMYQEEFADNAVSLTINLPSGSVDRKRVRRALIKWLPQLKGTTLMVDDSRPQAPYERMTRIEYLESKATAVDDAPRTCLGDACPIGNEGEV